MVVYKLIPELTDIGNKVASNVRVSILLSHFCVIWRFSVKCSRAGRAVCKSHFTKDEGLGAKENGSGKI